LVYTTRQIRTLNERRRRGGKGRGIGNPAAVSLKFVEREEGAR